MLIVDAHQDLAFNALNYGRDYRIDVKTKRRSEAGTAIPETAGLVTLGLPDSLRAGVGVVFATIFTAPQSNSLIPLDKMTYTTPQQAYALGLAQWDYYQRLFEAEPRLQAVTDIAELDAVLSAWQLGHEAARKQGLVLLIENADVILEPRQFEEWYARGVRIVGPAWTGTRYCGGTGAPGPLTSLGVELLDVMADLGAILDLSHMAEQAYFQALERYDGVVIASHSNPRRFVNSDRHLSDDMILQLAERDGVIGIVLYNRFLREGWTRASAHKRDVPLSIAVDAIDYVCQLTGSAAHVGIGTDFDGGFGAESIPDGMDSIADLPQIAHHLHARGFSEADVAAVMGGNMVRCLRQALS
jgi:membrane dipeptidase